MTFRLQPLNCLNISEGAIHTFYCVATDAEVAGQCKSIANRWNSLWEATRACKELGEMCGVLFSIDIEHYWREKNILMAVQYVFK